MAYVARTVRKNKMGNEYSIGTRVTFADGNATVSDGVVGLREGTVTGLVLRDEEGKVTHVPVFAERDGGREATTVWVAVGNIVATL